MSNVNGLLPKRQVWSNLLLGKTMTHTHKQIPILLSLILGLALYPAICRAEANKAGPPQIEVIEPMEGENGGQ